MFTITNNPGYSPEEQADREKIGDYLEVQERVQAAEDRVIARQNELATTVLKAAHEALSPALELVDPNESMPDWIGGDTRSDRRHYRKLVDGKSRVHQLLHDRALSQVGARAEYTAVAHHDKGLVTAVFAADRVKTAHNGIATMGLVNSTISTISVREPATGEMAATLLNDENVEQLVGYFGVLGELEWTQAIMQPFHDIDLNNHLKGNERVKQLVVDDVNKIHAAKLTDMTTRGLGDGYFDIPAPSTVSS